MPPVTIAVSYVLINIWASNFNIGLAIGWLILDYSLRLAIFQLLAYSLLMEFLIVPKLRNIYAIAIISGILMILAITSTFMAFFGQGTTAPFAYDKLTPVLGFTIGAVLGYILKRLHPTRHTNI
ncbi:hypothetical protein [Leptothoe kymatousa]|nr:hypothetical protein [Leptothoe kymatousa]